MLKSRPSPNGKWSLAAWPRGMWICARESCCLTWPWTHIITDVAEWLRANGHGRAFNGDHFGRTRRDNDIMRNHEYNKHMHTQTTYLWTLWFLLIWNFCFPASRIDKRSKHEENSSNSTPSVINVKRTQYNWRWMAPNSCNLMARRHLYSDQKRSFRATAACAPQRAKLN